MNPFIVNYDITEISQLQITELLDSKSEIRNWIAPFAGTVLVIAAPGQTSSTLSRMIHAHFPKARIAVSLTGADRTAGWMPEQFWELLNKLPDSGKWPALPASPLAPGSLKGLASLLGPAPANSAELAELLKGSNTVKTLGGTLADLAKKK